MDGENQGQHAYKKNIYLFVYYINNPYLCINQSDMGKLDRAYKRTYHIEWWEKLSQDEKMKWKKHYEKVCELTKKHKFPFPNMYDTTTLRVSKLADKHISRIRDFVSYDVVNDKRIY